MRTYRPLFFRGSHIEDLIKEGLSGDELLTKFRERQAELHIAIENGIAESGEAARKCRADNDETEDLIWRD